MMTANTDRVASMIRDSTTVDEFRLAAQNEDTDDLIVEMFRYSKAVRLAFTFVRKQRDRWFVRATEHAKRIEQLETALVDWRKVADTDFAALFVETGKLLDIADRIIADRAATEQLIQQASEEVHEAANLTGKST